MLNTSYESLRLDIQNYIERIDRQAPDRIEPIEEYTGDEILTGKSVATPDSMLRLGKIAVPLLDFRFLWRVGVKATASFAETRSYGKTRRIWLPGIYYARDDAPSIAVTHEDSLVNAWNDLGKARFNPVGHLGYDRQSQKLLQEAAGIARDVGVAAPPSAHMIISTGVTAHEQPPGH